MVMEMAVKTVKGGSEERRAAPAPAVARGTPPAPPASRGCAAP